MQQQWLPLHSGDAAACSQYTPGEKGCSDHAELLVTALKVLEATFMLMLDAPKTVLLIAFALSTRHSLPVT